MEPVGPFDQTQALWHLIRSETLLSSPLQESHAPVAIEMPVAPDDAGLVGPVIIASRPVATFEAPR